jgi:hypothetical protein
MVINLDKKIFEARPYQPFNHIDGDKVISKNQVTLRDILLIVTPYLRQIVMNDLSILRGKNYPYRELLIYIKELEDRLRLPIDIQQKV